MVNYKIMNSKGSQSRNNGKRKARLLGVMTLDTVAILHSICKNPRLSKYYNIKEPHCILCGSTGCNLLAVKKGIDVCFECFGIKKVTYHD